MTMLSASSASENVGPRDTPSASSPSVALAMTSMYPSDTGSMMLQPKDISWS